MPAKLTYEKVEQIVLSRNYSLVSKEYGGYNSPLIVTCPKGHLWTTTLNIFNAANCKACSKTASFSLQFVTEEFNKKGYKLLSTKYEGCFKKLDVICPNGHNYSVSFNNFYNHGSICSTCSRKRKPIFDEVFECFKKQGYTLLTITYDNCDQKLETICPNGHPYSVNFYKFFHVGTRCTECSGHKKHELSYVKEVVEKEGYSLLSTQYENAMAHIELICPKNHLYTVSFHSFKDNGTRCPICGCDGTSKEEKGLCDFIKTLIPEIKENTKKIIYPFELDIYISDLNLAIEYNGLYWHSEEYKNRKYHINKQKMCNNKDIRLISIFGDEWLERQEQVKGYLKSVLGKNEIKLFARKADLKEVSKKEARDFLETYHIQGSTNFEIAFGLYFNNELMAVVTGGSHHRQGHDNIFILNRLAFKSNVSIAGGSSRLLKHLIEYAKEKGFQKLLSWSDNRFSEGRVYGSIGFVLEDEHGPDYSYVNGRTRISKQSCSKKLLIKKGAKGTMTNTEKELALTLGLVRIWDCGKKAWSINLSQ